MSSLEADRTHLSNPSPPHRDVEASTETGFDRAVRAVDHRLTFACHPAAGVPAQWCAGSAPDRGAPVEQWWAHFASQAVGQAVGRALGSLRVDGTLWLDPHEVHAPGVHAAIEELVVRFAVLRGGLTSPAGDWSTRAGRGVDRAVRAVDYRLVFAYESGPRRFDRATMFGQDVPDAYNPGASVVGEWYGGDVLADDAPVERWWTHFAGMAVGEAIHETLEWLRVDDEPWLDPHGAHENTIHLLVEDFVARLAALRHHAPETTPPPRSRDEGADDDR